MTSRTDERLVGAVGDGAGDAFAEFYGRYERPVLAFFMRRVRNAEVAADLAAETFARAAETRKRFDPSRGSAASWLFGIAGNVLGASARRGRVEDEARQRLRIHATALPDQTLQAIAELEADSVVSAALAVLPEDQRAAIKAHILDGDQYAAVAADLQITPAVARKRVSRGLATLRSTLGSNR